MCPEYPDSDTDPILASVELFLRATGMTASAFGMAAVGDPVLVLELRNGREPRRATRARIRAFINAALAD
jgi:hypothetical protein